MNQDGQRLDIDGQQEFVVDRPFEVRSEFRKLGFEKRIGSHDRVGGEEGVGLFNFGSFDNDGAQGVDGCLESAAHVVDNLDLVE